MNFTQRDSIVALSASAITAAAVLAFFPRAEVIVPTAKSPPDPEAVRDERLFQCIINARTERVAGIVCPRFWGPESEDESQGEPPTPDEILDSLRSR